jgi:hypothetical protein
MKFPRTRYVRLLEEERVRLLKENEELKVKAERLERAILLSNGGTAGREYMNRTEPKEARTPKPSPIQSWFDYQAKYSEHMGHESPVETCQFCLNERAAKESRAKLQTAS